MIEKDKLDNCEMPAEDNPARQSEGDSGFPNQSTAVNPQKSDLPLDDPIDEAIAQFRATPRALREFKTKTALVQHFNISRPVFYRREARTHVLQRAQYLIGSRRISGDLQIKLAWEQIVRSQIKKAKKGNTRAAKFCRETVWPDDPIRKLLEW